MMTAIEWASVGKGYERRRKPRIYTPFPAIVQGKNEGGEHFKVETVIDTFSVESLYLRMLPCVEKGAKLSVLVGLKPYETISDDSPRLAIDGVVQRIEEKPGGACGVAITFKKVNFL